MSVDQEKFYFPQEKDREALQLMKSCWVGTIFKKLVVKLQLLRKYLEDEGHCLNFQSTKDYKDTYLKGVVKMNEIYSS